MNDNLPKFDDFMLPILRMFEDGNVHTRSEIKTKIYSDFTPEQLSVMLPSGVRGVIPDRVNWAIYYLRNALAIKDISRGVYQISDNGRVLLKGNLKKISVNDLKQFSEFGFKKSKNEVNELEKINLSNSTPIEQITSIINFQNKKLEEDLLNRIMDKDPSFFEELILKLLEKMGYGRIETTSKTHDNGIDGIVYPDVLGVDRIYTQAKRYSKGNNVQAPDIDKFIGVLHQSLTRSNKGIFITTSDFSTGARESALRDGTVNVVLINGQELVKLLIQYNVGVKVRDRFVFKEIDEEVFSEGFEDENCEVEDL